MRSSYLLLAFTFGLLSATVKAQEKEHSNHLVNETSPYLLTHAHNPVDWYPWGEEKGKEGKEDDLPLGWLLQLSLVSRYGT